MGDGPMRFVHAHNRRRRATGALGVVAIVLGSLALQFFRVQMLQSNDYMLQSESNRLRPLPVAAPRGAIFDRNDRVIADNVPGYVVYVLRESPESTRQTLERLRPHLGLSDERIEILMERYRRWEPLVVEIDADFEAVSILEERREDFPGIVIEPRPKRRYIAGNAVSHVLGYVNEITAEELAEPRFSEYEPGLLIGKVGIERQYEERLQGRRGVRYLEGRCLGPHCGLTRRYRRRPRSARRGYSAHARSRFDGVDSWHLPGLPRGGGGRTGSVGRRGAGIVLGSHVRSERVRERLDPGGMGHT